MSMVQFVFSCTSGGCLYFPKLVHKITVYTNKVSGNLPPDLVDPILTT